MSHCGEHHQIKQAKEKCLEPESNQRHEDFQSSARFVPICILANSATVIVHHSFFLIFVSLQTEDY